MTTVPRAPIPLPFLDACLRGLAKPEDAHEALRAWNAGDQRIPIHIHLGMTEAEWKLYMEAEGNLERILQARRSAHLYKPQPPKPERARRRW